MKQRSSGAYRGAAGPVRRERASGARGRRDGGRRKPAREERGRLRRGLVLGFWEEEEPGAGRKMLAVAVAGEKRREVVVVVVPPWWVECVIVAWLGGGLAKIDSCIALHEPCLSLCNLLCRKYFFLLYFFFCLPGPGNFLFGKYWDLSVFWLW
jgi:hypothetical protein